MNIISELLDKASFLCFKIYTMILFLFLGLNWQFKGPNGGDFTYVSGKSCRILVANFFVAYYSTDCGLNFQRINNLINIYGVIVGNSRANVFLVFGYYNTSNFSSWNQLNYPWSSVENIEVISDNNSDTIFIITDSVGTSKIYRSLDGTNFSFISKLNNVIATAINFKNNKVYLTVDSSGIHKLYASNDLGISWNLINNNLSLSVSDIAINPSNVNHIVVIGQDNNGNFGIQESSDGGASFSPIGSPTLYGTDVEFVSSTTILLSSLFPAGIYKGTNSGNWNFTRVFQDEISVSLSVDGNNVYSAILGQGFSYSSNGGDNFSIRNNNLVGHIAPSIANFLISVPTKFFISNSRTNKLMFINMGGNVYVSDNNNNLISCSNEFEMGGSVAFAPYNENTILISGLKLNNSFYFENLKKTTNGCSGNYQTLLQFSILQLPNYLDSIIAGIHINSNPNSMIFITNPRNLLYSNDGGLTRSVVRGSSNTSVFCHRCIDTMIYVNYDSIFISYNGGQTYNLLLTDPILSNYQIINIAYKYPYILIPIGVGYKYYNITNLSDSSTITINNFYVYDIEISSGGSIFVVGYDNNNIFKIAKISLNGNVQFIDNLPSLGGYFVVLNNYIWLYDGAGFWVADYTSEISESKQEIKMVSLRNGILFKNYEGNLKIYDISGKFIREIHGNFISYNEFKKGIYIVKIKNQTYKVLIR